LAFWWLNAGLHFRLSQEQAHVLNQKLRELIRDPPLPTAEEVANRSQAENEKEAKNRTKLIADNEKARQTIFDAVWEQRKPGIQIEWYISIA